MSKSLRSMETGERERAIARRLKGRTGGLGYLAAQDAQAVIDGRKPTRRKGVQENAKKT